MTRTLAEDMVKVAAVHTTSEAKGLELSKLVAGSMGKLAGTGEGVA